MKKKTKFDEISKKMSREMPKLLEEEDKFQHKLIKEYFDNVEKLQKLKKQMLELDEKLTKDFKEKIGRLKYW